MGEMGSVAAVVAVAAAEGEVSRKSRKQLYKKNKLPTWEIRRNCGQLGSDSTYLYKRLLRCPNCVYGKIS
jgi:hypothetical protein